jgi:hypothetical protein
MSPWNMLMTAKMRMCFAPERVYGPFFVMEPTVAGIVYLDMLQQFLMKMTKKDAFTSSNPLIHYLGEVRDYLSTRCPGPWIIIAWPSHSLVLTPLDISYGDS